MGELIKVDFKNKKRKDNNDIETIDTEPCILCRKDTRIPRDSDINDPIRLGRYVEGAGQVCKNCPMK